MVLTVKGKAGLLLNVFQSELVRQPKVEVLAVMHVKALVELERPLPRSVLKELLPMMRLVVEAVMNDE